METMYRIQKMLPEHYDSAAKLWSMVFGDDEALVHEFYRLFGEQESFAICAVHKDGDVVCAAYCPSGTDYITADGEVHKGRYLYAVATHPDHRKQRLASLCCNQARAHTLRGEEYLFTKPSEESLYPWYEENIELFPVLGGKRMELNAKPTAAPSMEPVSFEEYFKLRSELLSGTAHVRHSIEWMEWESLLHNAYGGGFYAFGDHIADLYFDGTGVQVNELLPHPTEGEAEPLLQGIMAAMGAEKCVCTLFGEENYVSAASKDGQLPPNAWFGPCYG